MKIPPPAEELYSKLTIHAKIINIEINKDFLSRI